MNIITNYQVKLFDVNLCIKNQKIQKNPSFGNNHMAKWLKNHYYIVTAAMPVLTALAMQNGKIGSTFRDATIRKQIDDSFNNKPVFNTYHSMGEKSIKHAGIGKYLTVDATEEEGYVGTAGLACCIGIAIVNKKDGKPLNMSIAHFCANDIRSLESLFYAMKDPTELDIVLISTENDKYQAQKILYELLTSDIGKKIKNINVDLTCSYDFAVNTKTGEISINLPREDFDYDENNSKFHHCLQKSKHQILEDIKDGVYRNKYTGYPCNLNKFNYF